MATAQEKQELSTLRGDVSNLKTDVEVIKTDMRYVKKASEKMETFLESNRSGITTATLLNSKVVTAVLGGIVAAGLFFASKVAGQ